MNSKDEWALISQFLVQVFCFLFSVGFQTQQYLDESDRIAPWAWITKLQKCETWQHNSSM